MACVAFSTQWVEFRVRPMPSASYYRQQADMCLRLSRRVRDDVAVRLIEMAEEYRAKANDADGDDPSLPPYMANRQSDE
jgi:hypothetical protein